VNIQRNRTSSRLLRIFKKGQTLLYVIPSKKEDRQRREQRTSTNNQSTWCLSLDGAALRDVDTIKELTDILVAGDLADVVDHGSRLGDSLEVVADKVDLILDLLVTLDSDTREHLDRAGTLLAKEVVDGDHLLVVRNKAVDGEVSIDKAHAVLVALGDTDDHVLDVTGNAAHAGHVLAGSEPHLNNKLLLLLTLKTDIHVADMTEVADELTTRTLDGDHLLGGYCSDSLRNINVLNKMEDLTHVNLL